MRVLLLSLLAVCALGWPVPEYFLGWQMYGGGGQTDLVDDTETYFMHLVSNGGAHATGVTGTNLRVPGVFPEACFQMSGGDGGKVTIPTADMNAWAAGTCITMAMWVNAAAANPYGTFLKNWGSVSGGLFHWGLNAAGTNQEMVWDGLGTSVTLADPTPFPLNAWNHVAFTKQGTTVKLYTNGVVVATGTASLAPAATTLGCMGVGVKFDDACAAPAPTANLPGPFSGMMDDILLLKAIVDPLCLFNSPLSYSALIDANTCPLSCPSLSPAASPVALVSSSPSPSPSPSVAVAVVSPTRSPQIVGSVQLRLATAADSNVTGSDIATAIGATGTITVIGKSRGTRDAHSHSTRAGSCLANPFTETLQLLFSLSGDVSRLTSLVNSGAAAVTNSGLCIQSASSTITNGVQPSPSPVVVYSPSNDKIAIGLGVGFGVGIPLLFVILLVVYCCCWPWGAASRWNRVKVIENAPQQAASQERPTLSTSDDSSSYTSGYSGSTGYSA